ncbi:DUF262 domain-containing protein [Pseudomonas sp.]|uniref:DUF262 domain-containing protein n=1 Tax=Pseudomonas sp. TaxID=306 RepID=UPI003FD7DA69
MNARVHSEVQTAATLCHQQIALVIPSYQRPYVWPSEDVVGLLEQIIEASAYPEPHYYLGTVLTAHVPNHEGSGAAVTYELIDGQQRMTTLMVLALAFVELSPASPLKALAVLGTAPRLTFNIREQVQAQISVWAGLHAAADGGAKVEDNLYLKHLSAARKAATDRLRKLLQEKGEHVLEAVGDFLLHRVKWVNNIMPTGMDLNRLFATLNTSGLQLEQSDILKSRLMKKITRNKVSYEGIWQACENMGDYFERNVRRVFSDAAWGDLKFTDLRVYSPKLFSLERPADSRSHGLTITEINRQRPPRIESAASPAKQQESEDRYQSIISFGLLLMHALRIYLKQKGGGDIHTRLNDNRLNDCFESFVKQADMAETKSFIECLWQVRYQFDLWVQKWMRRGEDDERFLSLTSINTRAKGKVGYGRDVPAHTSDLAQLQSVRYFTGERTAQYWLTPFLGGLIAKPAMNEKQALGLLERIDNQLSLTDATQKEASFLLLSRDCASPTQLTKTLDYLGESWGTGFEHYWFQKVEYILWRHRRALKCFQKDSLESYRISSKNSVEHVHPQNEEFQNRLPDSYLHSFGNLVLLSPGENSSYSNLAVIKKQAAFRAKPKYDSLKLAHMFHLLGKGEVWGEVEIERHRRDMLELIAAHYHE